MSTRQLIIILCIVVSIAGVIYFYLPNYSKYQDLLRKEALLQSQIDALRSEVQRMEEEKYLLENDVQYLEKVVREKLGRVEPGETVYKVIDTAIEEEPPATQQKP